MGRILGQPAIPFLFLSFPFFLSFPISFREFGFLREMLVAPISRFTIVIGKLLSGASPSILQGMLLLLFSPILGIELTIGRILAMLVLITILSIDITAMGLYIASFLTSLEGFNAIMNFIVLPMFF